MQVKLVTEESSCTAGSRKIHPFDDNNNHVSAAQLWKHPERGGTMTIKKIHCECKQNIIIFYNDDYYLPVCSFKMLKKRNLYSAGSNSRGRIKLTHSLPANRPDGVEGPLLKVMFGRRQSSGLSQLQHLQTLRAALCHLLKPDTHTHKCHHHSDWLWNTCVIALDKPVI